MNDTDSIVDPKKYTATKNKLIFNLFDNLEDPNFSYEGDLNFKPFYSNLRATIKEISILHLLNSNTLILQLFIIFCFDLSK